jgi:hypothetical protein
MAQKKSIIPEMLKLARAPETTPEQSNILRTAAHALLDTKLKEWKAGQ